MLNSGDRMPWGKHAGKLLAHVPLAYWKWFLEQSWRDYREELRDYAQARLGLECLPPYKAAPRKTGPAMPPTEWIGPEVEVKEGSEVPF